MTGPTRIYDRNMNPLSDKAAAFILASRRQPPKAKLAIERMIDRLHDGMDVDAAEALLWQETGRKGGAA